jgi:hypothetical protein
MAATQARRATMPGRRASETTRLSCGLPIGQVVGDGERVPLTGLLRFDAADPIAVSLVVRVGSAQTVEWTFARDLLVVGSERPAGVGDVRVRPSQDAKRRILALTLASPDGKVELELPSQRVDAFISQTYAAIPSEVEADLIDWSSELEWLLRPEDPVNDQTTDR